MNLQVAMSSGFSALIVCSRVLLANARLPCSVEASVPASRNRRCYTRSADQARLLHHCPCDLSCNLPRLLPACVGIGAALARPLRPVCVAPSLRSVQLRCGTGRVHSHSMCLVTHFVCSEQLMAFRDLPALRDPPASLYNPSTR